MRKGVNKVALRLFEHNEKAYRAAVRMMEQYGKAAIVHPTGTGKSYIAFKLIEDNPEKVVIWLSPSEYIFKTQLESLKRNDPDFPLANVHFYTYAKLMCCTQAQLGEIAAQKPAYIILDEFHRAGAECWGESTVALLKLCPDAKLLGLTATNVRYPDNNRDMAEELFYGHIASDMNLGEAVVRGILPAPKYVTTVYQYQKALAKYQARVDNLRTPGIQDVNQKYLDALRRALEQADGLDKVFTHHITNKDGKYIVFCANKEHMDEMVSHVPEWFAGVNPDVVVYEAYADDPNTDKAFADFKTDTSNRLKLLFCIDMLNEGVHVEGISGVILFRPTISPIIYKQQIGRALTAGDTAAPLILDVVNNFEGLTSISGLQSEMQESIDGDMSVPAGSDMTNPPDDGSMQKFPAFEGKDLDGNPVKSDELFSANAVTVVNFWFTTCNPCVGELSELDALNKELANKGGALIGVNTFTLDGDEAAISEAKDVLAKKGATYQNVYFDSDGEAGKFTTNIFAYPTTYVVDRSGNIVGEPIVGAITEKKQAETLQKLIEQALAADVG